MFQWMESLAPGIVAQAVLAISIVAAVGLALGSLGFRGIRLGTAGVLFVGIFFGQLGMRIDERILEFVRDFGLILFVYTIGLQVGPSFFSSLRRQGLQLNVLAAAVVLLGGLIAACFRGLFRFFIPAVAGIFSGATTNQVSPLRKLCFRGSKIRLRIIPTFWVWPTPWPILLASSGLS
jgi:putative transport protein